MSGPFRPSIVDRRPPADQVPSSAALPAPRLFPRRRRFSGAAVEETAMKITFRTLAAIAVGTMILMSAAAHADTRPGINPDEAGRLRYQVQQYQQMKRYAGADGLITRAEQARLNHKAEQLRRLIMHAKTN
jgi:hypothetical protein